MRVARRSSKWPADSVRDDLRAISLFRDISDSDLTSIAEIVTEKSYPAQAVIVEELTEPESFCIIARGKVQITKQLDNGEELVLAVQSNSRPALRSPHC
jgi:CRP-like cAMP-binding protein